MITKNTFTYHLGAAAALPYVGLEAGKRPGPNYIKLFTSVIYEYS
jgi:hypothetical protein